MHSSACQLYSACCWEAQSGRILQGVCRPNARGQTEGLRILLQCAARCDLQASAANRKKAVRSTWSIGMNKALAQNVSHEKVRLFGEAFAKIQEATGACKRCSGHAAAAV